MWLKIQESENIVNVGHFGQTWVNPWFYVMVTLLFS